MIILMMKGMFIRMKKSSKVRKNSVRINRNFFIFQGIMISLLLYLTWGSWAKFIIFIVLEMIAYCAFVYYLIAKKIKKKNNIKNVHYKEVYKKAKSNSRDVVESSENKGLRRVGKNYNWEISDHSSEQESIAYSGYSPSTTNRNTETPDQLNSGRSSINDSKKYTPREETKKFVPYRSPFEPIRPRIDEQAAEIDKASELTAAEVPDVEDAKVEITECKEENIEEVNIEDSIEDSIEGSIDDDMEENVEDSIEDDIEENVNDNLEFDIEDMIEETILDSQMDCNTLKEYNGEFEERRSITLTKVGNKVITDSKPTGNSAGLRYSPCTPEGRVDSQQSFPYTPAGRVDSQESFPCTPTGRVDSQQSSPCITVRSGKMRMDFAQYEPPVELLSKNEVLDYDEETEAYIEYNSHKLIDTLASFGVGAKVLNVSKGPTVTRYELQPNAGVKVSKIVNLADDIALNLAATGVRIEAPIPGKAAIGIEIPNKKNVAVFLRDVIETDAFQNYSSKLAFAVGKDIAGNVVVGDIAKMPHLLIAGATGSGKSVCINTLIISILYKASPAEVRLLMVDPKVVELGIYNGIPHLLIPVVTDPKKASGALTWAVMEMTNRYRLFAENNVRDLKGYNGLIKERGEGETLPQIVIIIDELADLMMVAPNEVEDSICRLAQMARAAGMHLVIATQRPSVNVITGVIKANIPSRISFAVSSQIDSRTILDMAGAEKLLGRGDMLFYPLGQPKPLRVQGSFISDKEVERFVTHIKSLQSAEYDEEILQKIENQTPETQKPDSSGDDELLPQAILMVLELGQASASLIQRKFKVGYSRAARILDQMEAWGVVSASDGSGKPRQILITRQEWIELNA